MKCPFCTDFDNRVLDSRLSKEGQVIRRRRECDHCHRRFTTYERVEEMLPQVVKKDGRREPYDRTKVLAGLQHACQKRPVSAEQLDSVVEAAERKLMESGEREVATTSIGEELMRQLQQIDEVAYVRFASVYRSFKDLSEFMTELKDLLDARATARKP